MKLLDRHGAFVKDQIFLQEKLASRYRDISWRSQKHLDNAEHMRAILRDLEKAQESIDSLAPVLHSGKQVISHGIAMKPEDLENLPQELLSELSLSETDKLEFEIIEIIRNAGGVLPLNKVIIGLYRKTGAVHKRPALTSRLYRMVQRGRLYNVPEQKGVYSISPINPDEVKGMFGAEQSADEYSTEELQTN